MKILVLAQREWLNKGFVAGGALLAGLGALLIPLIFSSKGAPVASVADIQTATALCFGILLPALFGLVLGAGVIAPDLQEGRMGFYLARPVSPLVLFAGKLLGVILFVFVCGLLVALPVMLAHRVMLEWAPGLIPLAIFSIAMPLVGHTLSIAFRARTPWLLLDIACLGATLGVLAWFLRRMMALLAFREMTWFMGGFGIMVLLVLAVAGYQQMAKGRTDLKRGHRSLSISMVAIPILSSVAAMLTLHGIEHLDASQIAGTWYGKAAGQGPWVLVSAERAGLGRECNVALNTDSGQGIRLGAYPEAWSENGKRLVSFSPSNPFQNRGDLECWVTDLGSQTAYNRATGIQIQAGSYPWPVALDVEGKRLAFCETNALSVYDVDSGQLLARHTLETPHFFASRLLFLGPEKLRAYLDEGKASEHKMNIYELDLRTAHFVKTGTVQLDKNDTLLDRSPRTEKLLVRRWDNKNRGLDLCDARTGEVQKTLVAQGHANFMEAAFLFDGSILVSVAQAGECRLRHLHFEGNELWSTPFPQVSSTGSKREDSAVLFGEMAPGLYRVGLPRLEAGTNFHTMDVDLNSHAMHESGAHRLPALCEQQRRNLLGPPEPGSLATRLEASAEGALKITDPNGQIRVLTKESKRRD